MRSDRGRAKRTGVLVSLICLLVSAGGVVWLWRGGGNLEQLEEDAGSSFEGVEFWESESLPWEVEAVPVPRPKQPRLAGELRAAEVIGNPDCGMRVGTGATRGMAMVVVSDAAGARFSVLDETGAVQAGELSFSPYRYMLGKRADGSIVAGFGRLQPQHGVNQGIEAPGPLQIHLDGQVIEARETIWEFGVANDGSSYWLVEPLGDESSRLVVRNLDEGTERHYFLGDRYEPQGFHKPYGTFYTPDGNELHMAPGNLDAPGEGVHYFFPAGGDRKARKLRVEGLKPWDQANVVSSTEAYFFFTGDESHPNSLVEKRRFDWATGETTTEWGLPAPSGVTAGPMQAASDGAWLLFETHPAPRHLSGRSSQRGDWALYVLDASTGEPVFVLPTMDKQAQLALLGSVLGPDATIEQVGHVDYAEIDSDRNQLMVGRSFKAEGQPPEERDVLDVYDLSAISLDSQPDLRVPNNRQILNPCASATYPGQLLALENGRLAYAPVR